MRPSAYLALAASLFMAAGCTRLVGLPAPADGRQSLPLDEQAETRSIVGYLTALDLLEHSTPDKQLAITESYRTAWVSDPSLPKRLRYAFVLASPGHPGSDASAARELIDGALAQADSLLPSEHALVGFFARFLAAQQDARPAPSVPAGASSSTTDSQRLAGLRRQLRQEASENERLRAELKEALAKQSAIAALEGGSPAPRTGGTPP